MGTTFFQGKNGNVTSVRTGNSSIKLTSYLGNSNGGATFYSKNMVTRMNNNGQAIATGLRSGRNVTYLGKSTSFQIKPFI